VPPGLSEADFLARQSAEAKAAVSATLDRMRQDLKDGADLQAWTREYPWPSVGIAAALGFLAAAAITPAGRDPHHEKWSALLHEVLGDERAAKVETETHAAAHQSAVGSVFKSLLKTFGGALQSSLIAAVSAKAQQAADQPSQNGHEAAANN